MEEGNYKELQAYSFDIKAHACIPHRCSNMELMFYIKDHYADMWGELVQPFLALQSFQFENVLNKFKEIIPEPILRCMLFGLVERLGFLKMIEGEE
ncbi:hypothetical protein D3C85_1572270 [compost metagenome]